MLGEQAEFVSIVRDQKDWYGLSEEDDEEDDGVRTPHFWSAPTRVSRAMEETVGHGTVVTDGDLVTESQGQPFTGYEPFGRCRGQEWPRWPGFVTTETVLERAFPG